MEILITFGIISLLIFFNAIFVAAEFAIVAAPRTRMAQLAEDGNEIAQRVLKILLEPVLQNRFIAAAQVGITIVSLGLGMYGEHALADWFLHFLEDYGLFGSALAHTLASVLAVGLLTYLHVVLGEMIPKSLALQSPEPTVLALARPMAIFSRIFYPVVSGLNYLGDGIVRLMGIPPLDREDRLFTSEELEYIVEESLEGGMLEPSESLFIENIFDFQERKVEQVMTPRTRIAALPVNLDQERIYSLICERRKSRFLIFEKTLDQIIGVLHIKDFARYIAHKSETEFDLRSMLRPVLFVPESLNLGSLLLQLRQEQLQLAIVIDEFGGTAGVVTMEDLVEEVVGEIQDEFDREILPIEEVDPSVLRVRGDLLIDELNQLYELKIESEEANTIGGLVMSLLGRIPQPGDKIDLDGMVFEVESVERFAVTRVIISLNND